VKESHLLLFFLKGIFAPASRATSRAMAIALLAWFAVGLFGFDVFTD
jgi:hypothetical protein